MLYQSSLYLQGIISKKNMTIETTKLNFNVSYGLRVTLAITTTRSNKPYPLPEYNEEEALVAEK